jgi:hypothetical protein
MFHLKLSTTSGTALLHQGTKAAEDGLDLRGILGDVAGDQPGNLFVVLLLHHTIAV